jgi:hypothetical protein
MDILELRTLLSVSIINGGGSGYVGNGAGGPPDVTGMAGPSSYIEVTNDTITIFGSKANGTILTQHGINDFFFNPTIGNESLITPGSRGTADSTGIFDNLMGGDGRFIIGDIDIEGDATANASQFIFAVSKSNNPTTLTTSDWNFYHVTTTEGSGSSATWTDYPGNFGFNADAVVVTFNMAQFNTGAGKNFLTGNAQVVSIDASDLAGGVSQASLHSYHNDISGSNSYRPTNMHDSVAGDPMWLLQNPDDGSHINVTKMTNVLSNSASFSNTSLSLPGGKTFSTGDITPLNPDGSEMDDIDTRILKAGEYNNTIAATHKIKISGNEADVQWYAIDVSGTPAFQQVGRIGFGSKTYSVDPAIDINSQGEIGLGFMESDQNGGSADSSTGGFISTFVTARKATDAAGTMQPTVLVPAGTGSGNISGRIGDFSGMNVDPTNGTFWHTNEFGGGGPTVIANFTPEDPPVVTPPSDQGAVEGASKLFSLGSFADDDGGPWSVKVNWGDGSTDTFSAAAPSALSRSHTYVEEGNNTVTVTVTDNTGLSDSGTFQIGVTDPPVDGQAVAVNAVEGLAFTGKAVATFTDPGGAEVVGDYSATIDWGDGVTSTGTITLSGGTFTVAGDHTYLEESAGHTVSGKYPVVVTITHENAPTTTVNTAADVADPAVAAMGGFTFTAVEGMPSGTQTVAKFTDPGGAEALSDYSASIDWGDGTTSTGTITVSGGVYTVTGDHTYATGLGNPADFGNTLCDATPPKYHKAITVTINHENAPKATAVSDAVISIAPGTAHLSNDGSLIVVGTAGDDKIQFTPVGNQARTVNVKLGSTDLGTFTVGTGGRIVVAAIAGNDDVQVAGSINVDTALYGGPGNDRLNGGAGRNIEIGCEGDDELLAGKAGDLLVGGLGSDHIVGGNGNDILVAGTIVDGANVEDDQYVDLVGILSAGQITLPFKALDDGAVDRLTGAAGIDTAYYNFQGGGIQDIFTDKAENAFDI